MEEEKREEGRWGRRGDGGRGAGKETKNLQSGPDLSPASPSAFPGHRQCFTSPNRSARNGSKRGTLQGLPSPGFSPWGKSLDSSPELEGFIAVLHNDDLEATGLLV